MGEGQASHLHKAEVYNLIAEGREQDIVAMGENAIPGLISILKGNAGWRKPPAIAILSRIKGSSALRALRMATTDRDDGVRLLAVNAIARKEGRTVERTLRDMVEDPSAHVRSAAQFHLLRRRSSNPPAPSRNSNGNRARI